MQLENAVYTRLAQQFTARFGEGAPPRLFFAPGRVNLIGEHIDYNGGLVLPAALDLGNYLLIRENNTRTVRLAADDLGDRMVSAPLDSLDAYRGKDWGAYQLGVFDVLQKAQVPLRGVDCLYYATLPFGAGLSSSASIEVVTAYAATRLFGVEMDLRTLALLAQRAENEFVGVHCGIMDQYACANGMRGHAMLLDCRAVEAEQVPLPMDGYALVIANTNHKRSLGDSKYNERRAECTQGLALLRMRYPGLPDLCALQSEQLDAAADCLSGVIAQRVRHVVTENERVKQSAAALHAGDLQRFGALMDASHRSLREDYEVTGDALDTMVRIARGLPGCIGARMTGAGFGGCTVNLVEAKQAGVFAKTLHILYMEETGVAPEVYCTTAGGGVTEL